MKRIALLLCSLLPLDAAAQAGFAFSYQGRLEDNGIAANVDYDFQFRLCGDAACATGDLTIARNAVPVRNGVFTTQLDFGAAFGGQPAFLEISLRRTGSGNPLQLLLPRQAVLTVPGAAHAKLASVADTNAVDSTSVVNNSIASIDIANGTVAGNDVDATQVQLRVSGTCAPGNSIRAIAGDGTVACEADDVGATNAWTRNGNAGTTPATEFLGTSDNQALEVRVNNQRAWRVAPSSNGVGSGAANLIGGNDSFVAPNIRGATIAGGGGTINFVTGPNRVLGDYGTIGGGYGNAAGLFSTIVGGRENVAVRGGTAIGSFNLAGGEGSIAMGLFAKVRSAPGSGLPPEGTTSADDGTFVFADDSFGDFASTGADQFLVRANGGVAFTTAQLPPGQPANGEFVVDAANGFGINERDPGGTLHVKRGDSGATTGSNNAGIFEGAASTFVRILSPSANERGVLFGDEVNSASGGIVYNSGAANGLQFRTNGNVARMTLTAGGRLGIGRTPDDTTGNLLEVNGNASKSAAGSWLANSDARIKHQVAPVANALDTLMRIRPVTFRYTAEYLAAHPELADERYYNVVAEVFPDAVTRSGDPLPGATSERVLQVDTHPAIITAIAAIQELAARNERLERRNAELEARLARLERR